MWINLWLRQTRSSILMTVDLQQAGSSLLDRSLKLLLDLLLTFWCSQQGQIVWHNQLVLFSPMEWKDHEKFDIKDNNSMDCSKDLDVMRSPRQNSVVCWIKSLAVVFVVDYVAGDYWFRYHYLLPQSSSTHCHNVHERNAWLKLLQGSWRHTDCPWLEQFPFKTRNTLFYEHAIWNLY